MCWRWLIWWWGQSFLIIRSEAVWSNSSGCHRKAELVVLWAPTGGFSEGTTLNEGLTRGWAAHELGVGKNKLEMASKGVALLLFGIMGRPPMWSDPSFTWWKEKLQELDDMSELSIGFVDVAVVAVVLLGTTSMGEALFSWFFWSSDWIVLLLSLSICRLERGLWVLGSMPFCFSFFLMHEFHKFFISLSVLPGSWTAIWDHLYKKYIKTSKKRLSLIAVRRNSMTVKNCSSSYIYDDGSTTTVCIYDTMTVTPI